MRKLFFILLTIIGLTSMPINSYASEKEITIYFFRGYNCIHCEGSLEYLNNHKDEIPTNIKIVTYEVWKNKNNEKLHQELVKKLEVPEKNSDSVPFLVIGNEYIVGMDGTKEEFDKVCEKLEKKRQALERLIKSKTVFQKTDVARKKKLDAKKKQSLS